jgi:hypothetical protein
MDISSDAAENISVELTAAEQAKLAMCVNPDGAAVDVKFDYGPELQDRILCVLWKHADSLAQGAKVIRPEYFPQKEREALCRLLLDYYRQYGGQPSKEWLVEAYKRQLPPTEDKDKKMLPWTGWLNGLSYQVEPELHERAALLELVQDFARHQSVKVLHHKLAIATTESGDPKRFDKVGSLMREFAMPSLSGAVKPYASWSELVGVAADQQEDWLIPNWSEYGCLTLFSSLPKLGKSTIVAELIACAMTGRDFYGQPVQGAPVLLVDPENREKTLVRRLNHALAGDGPGRVDEWFFRLNAFPKPLDNGYLRKAIEDIKIATGQDRVIVVLDTLRSCYAGAIENENDNAEMAGIVVPLKDLAAETNSALFLIHHNSKAADSYAGGTAILGSVDYWWNWRNDRAKRHGELSCWGRGDFTEPIELVFDPETQRNALYTAADSGQTDDEAALLAIPASGSGVTREQLADLWGCALTSVGRRLKAYVDAGRVECLSPENRRLGKTRYRQVAGAELAV